MKTLTWARTLIVSVSLLLQSSTLCFQARGASNNNFANAQVLIGSTGTITGNNNGATKEPGEPDHAGNPGGSSVWFRWTATATGQYAFNTSGSAIDTLLAVYTGTNVSALTAVASNDDSNTNLTSAVSVQAVAGTTYSIAVDGFDGETGALVLNWGPEIRPVNDDFVNATAIIGSSGTISGNNSGATREAGEPDHAGEPGGRSVWFRWTAPASGEYSFNTAGSVFDTLLAVYTGASVNALTLVASNDQAGASFTSAVSFSATSGTTYQVAVDGDAGQMGPLTLNWVVEPPPINDNFANATEITGSSGSISGSNIAATKEPGEPNHAGNPGGKSVWFRWTAPVAGLYSFNTAGSGFNTLVAAYTGASVNALSLVASNDNFGFDVTSEVSFLATGGTTYRVAVDGFGAQAGSLTLNWAPFNDPAVTFTTLHHFTNGINDGSSPEAGLILSGNTLYGTTVSGGSGAGAVFRINTDGTGYTNLHNFNGSGGANPYAELVLSGSTLYGTTYSGGSGYGIVFAVGTNGTGFTNLHSFPPTSGTSATNAEGANPIAGLVLAGNTLYGTARYGGASGNGTVFALKTDGSGFTNLHNFTATSGPSSTNSDGNVPSATLALSGGRLYGTANSGGSSGYGTIFALSTNGTGFTVLHSFNWTDGGAYPHALTISGNTLYGTANSGGPLGYGTVFAIKTNGTGFATVHAFTSSDDGANPNASLVLSADTLYGTALGGGKGNKGTVFAISTNGTDFRTLHNFTPTSGLSSTNSDGTSSRAGLVLSGNTIYGTAERGGASGQGTVFSLSLARPSLTILASGTNVVVAWPVSFAGFTLQAATNLALPNAWLPVSELRVTNNSQIFVSIPASVERKFFRLISQ
jgi:uncharacterized repeat protein (TIGR03803 family)